MDALKMRRRRRLLFLVAAIGLVGWVGLGYFRGQDSGFTGGLYDPEYRVPGVVPGGWADRSGFKAGDRVISVEGRLIEELGMESRWPLALAPRIGQKHRFVVERKGERVTLRRLRSSVSGCGERQDWATLAGLWFLCFRLWAFFTAEALGAQRFLTFWSVMAAPYLSRGLAEWVAARRLGAAWSAPRRAAAVAAACAALTAIECTRADLPLGVAIRPESYPGPACDFIAAAGVRGRAFNYFDHGGYLLWRFWPEKDRLPFMTTIPELATAQMRRWYSRAMAFPDDWKNLSTTYAFDWVLLKRAVPAENRYQDFLDADSTYALVFFDDVSALYVRRRGALADVAARYRYRWMAAGQARLQALASQAMASPETRAGLRAELERSIRSSPLSSLARRQAAALDAVPAAP